MAMVRNDDTGSYIAGREQGRIGCIGVAVCWGEPRSCFHDRFLAFWLRHAALINLLVALQGDKQTVSTGTGVNSTR
jgi:hypothetical protein